LNRTINKEIK